MNVIVRLLERIAALLPVPRDMSDEPLVVDPRVDPAALETYGRAQISQFGIGQGHEGAAPLPTRYATDVAADAREAERRRVDE
jgi:hypothetical protein